MKESCLIWRSHVSYEGVMSHMKESCLILRSHVSYEGVMSHMGCLDSFICYFHIYKLQVIFRKRATDYRALLRKTTCKDKVSNGSSYCMNKSSQPTYEWVVSLIYEFVISNMNESSHTWMSHVTHRWVMSHMDESCHPYRHESALNPLAMHTHNHALPPLSPSFSFSITLTHMITHNLSHSSLSYSVSHTLHQSLSLTPTLSHSHTLTCT